MSRPDKRRTRRVRTLWQRGHRVEKRPRSLHAILRIPAITMDEWPASAGSLIPDEQPRQEVSRSHPRPPRGVHLFASRSKAMMEHASSMIAISMETPWPE